MMSWAETSASARRRRKLVRSPWGLQSIGNPAAVIASIIEENEPVVLARARAGID
jgi:hypothetical protein